MIDWGELNFKPHEFACQHCPKNKNCNGHDDNIMDEKFIKALQEIRTSYGRSMVISSGYRCAAHPVEARKINRGGKPGSHYSGKAADIRCSGTEALTLLKVIMQYPKITGVGIQQTGPHSKRFIHVDTLEDYPRPNLWSY